MKKPRRVLVGLKSAEHVVELTDLACRVGARGASLLLIHVLELPAATPIDAELPEAEAAARKMLHNGERIARRAGMKVATRILHARSAGEALLGELKERKMELAVLGYHHRRTLGEVLLGTTAQHLARHAPCHLLLSIPARS